MVVPVVQPRVQVSVVHFCARSEDVGDSKVVPDVEVHVLKLSVLGCKDGTALAGLQKINEFNGFAFTVDMSLLRHEQRLQ